MKLNIIAIVNFDSMETLIEDIKTVVKNIKDNGNKMQPFEPDKSIYSFVGYDDFCDNDFQNYSKDYSEYLINEELEKQLYLDKIKKQKRSETFKDKIKYIFMCILGLVCVAGGIFRIIKDPSGLVKGIGVIIFGGVFLSFGILKLKEN